MIKRKLKICKGVCGLPKYIFSKGMCLQCSQRSDNVKAIKVIEKKSVKLSDLVKRLDDVFSIYIRTRDADENGIVKCFTCHKISHWKEMDCGHYWSRRIYSLRWDHINCQVQCKGCNIMNQGAGPQFSANIRNKYGQQSLDILEQRKNNKFKLERFIIESLINEYKSKTKPC